VGGTPRRRRAAASPIAAEANAAKEPRTFRARERRRRDAGVTRCTLPLKRLTALGLPAPLRRWAAERPDEFPVKAIRGATKPILSGEPGSVSRIGPHLQRGEALGLPRASWPTAAIISSAFGVGEVLARQAQPGREAKRERHDSA